jgi:hypothetical protein
MTLHRGCSVGLKMMTTMVAWVQETQMQGRSRLMLAVVGALG